MSGDGSTRVFIGLGSNLGDRFGNLQAAVRAVSRIDGVMVHHVSPVYESEPWGYAEQDDYLNAVTVLETRLRPAGLFQALKAVERDMGRMRAERNHPRIIDIDILLAGAVVTRDADLTVPHPRMHQRRFVLQPMCDIDPSVRHPVLGLSAADLLAACGDTGRLALFPRELDLPRES